jgi:hypothetical protein
VEISPLARISKTKNRRAICHALNSSRNSPSLDDDCRNIDWTALAGSVGDSYPWQSQLVTRGYSFARRERLSFLEPAASAGVPRLAAGSA